MPQSNPHAAVEIYEAKEVFEGSKKKTVESNNVTWDSWKHPRLFTNVNIELVTNEASQGVWQLFDPDYRVLNLYAKSAGVPQLHMRFWLGFGQELGEPVFKGLLARIERNDTNTTFRAYDMGYKMRLEKRPGYHSRLDDIAILKKLAERNGLKFEGPEKPLKLGKHDAMAQGEQNDWEHAMERAKDAGLVLYVRQDTLFAKYPAKPSLFPKLALLYGQDFVTLHGFNFSYKLPENKEGRAKSKEIRVRGKGGKRRSGKSGVSKRGHTDVLLWRDLPDKHKHHLDARAQAQKELEREHAIEGTIKQISPLSDARPDVRDTIQLLNFGSFFSGLYVCDSVTHDFSSSGLTTTYDLYADLAAEIQ
jgi:hypothetical protein